MKVVHLLKQEDYRHKHDKKYVTERDDARIIGLKFQISKTFFVRFCKRKTDSIMALKITHTRPHCIS